MVVFCPSRDLNFGDPVEASGPGLAAEIDDVIAAILVSRFSDRTVPEIWAMGGITVADFTSSVAYREIFGLGRQEGRQIEVSAITLRQFQRRCGTLSSAGALSNKQRLGLTDEETASQMRKNA